ncbi:UDP-N-acetylglucosamine 1-carboxyvinyltransferase [Chengkuizengella axinellae]|uniref:UDP-N-acetylglucosamine 1-carboxyvinyltransferase n=1 Tax=Chengkuizengella axinellae TaxID=3064388 RepID=A0ABT9IUX1_9BACL|nr:UDP-N-acetylglucosamine 1-carboxyvinyltransferase [Chengkuizengella sp. 2205SS18-9]MDP5273158.1 UDP-N-acetylglucosamine 1-carboxyvinyltransferase [Chengkuizengella sp. 2205SS18-9]
MEKLVIEGGRPLTGTLRIHGSKNAALPILAGCILVDGKLSIENVPDLLDIKVMIEILNAIGCEANHQDERVLLDTSSIYSHHIPEDLMKQMRSSIFMMGPLLARFGQVQVYQPGGCAIGERKIDLHLKGLKALGAVVEESEQTIICRAEKLIGADIHLDFPSVGATENILMAAVLAEGDTTIQNAAREPEIEDLANFLNKMGAHITGAGTEKIHIKGVKKLTPCHYRIIPDRIVAGTLMIAAAATGGNVELNSVCPEHLKALMHVLKKADVQITLKNDIIKINSLNRPKSLDRIVTSPYPAFPTDLQSQIMVLMSMSEGITTIKEKIFEQRFRHVDELKRMGADIRVNNNIAYIRGVPRLYGAKVKATDLRAGAALVVAGLAGKGTTTVEHIYHIDRGYVQIENIFKQLGANITRCVESPVSK